MSKCNPGVQANYMVTRLITIMKEQQHWALCWQ